MSDNSLLQYLNNFRREDLLLWTQVTSIHPNNQIYQLRFELLTAIILSIENTAYKNNALSRKQYELVVQMVNDIYGSYFYHMEDWKPFGQLKPIPIIFDRRKYYFFYGIDEHPYEQYRRLIDLFLKDSPNRFLNDFKGLLHNSLSFQTRIVTFITNNDEAKVCNKQIYVPSEVFVKECGVQFLVSPSDVSENSCYTAADFNNTPKELFNEVKKLGILKRHFINVEDKYYYSMPQVHLHALYHYANSLINNGSMTGKDISDNLTKCLITNASRLFTIRHWLGAILRRNNTRLDDKIDFVARVGENRLLLFKHAECATSIDCTKEIADAALTVNDTINDIRAEPIVGLAHYDRVFGVPPDELEYYGFVIYDNIHLDLTAQLPQYSNRIEYCCWLDIKCLFDIFDDGRQFVKFIQDTYELEARANVISIEYLDKLAYYRENNNSYPTVGQTPNMMIFDPHMWHHYYYAILFEKYEDDIYAWLELQYEHKFNMVRQYADDIYIFIDTAFLDGGMIVENSFVKYIVIQYPLNGYTIDSLNVKMYSKLLGPLFADYFVRLKDAFKGSFTDYNKIYAKYVVGLYPLDVIRNNADYKAYRLIIDNISPDTAMHVVSGIQGTNVLKSCVFYDKMSLCNTFNSPNNEGERYCIGMLYRSLLLHANPGLSIIMADKMTSEFIDANMMLDLKGYSIDAIPVENPKLEYYNLPIDDFKPEIMKVNREIAEYLCSSNIAPGIYSGDKVLEINDLIYAFLRDKITQTMEAFSDGLIYHVYEQIELAEGCRYNIVMQRNIDAAKHVEYDLLKRYRDELFNLSHMATPLKLVILPFALKNKIKGKKAITSIEWNYLQALGIVYFETSLIFDFVNFNLQEHSIELTDAYEFKEHHSEMSYDFEKYFLAESGFQLRKARSDSGSPIDLDVLIMKHIDDIERELMNQYGVTLKDIVAVLKVLGSSNIDSGYPPLTIAKCEEIIKYIVANTKDMNEENIVRVIEYLSLNISSFDNVSTIVPSRYNTKRERVNICPIIRIDDTLLFGNQMCLHAANLWFDTIAGGDFPYAIQQSGLRTEIEILRKDIERELEKNTIRLAKEALGSEYVLGNVKKYRTIGIEMDGNIAEGEIDALGIDRVNHIIYILEAKHRVRRITPYDSAMEIQKFYRQNRPYLDKLSEKEKFVNKHIIAIIRSFGITDTADWSIKKAFVVLHNYPFAFHRSYSVDVILIDNLKDYLTGSQNR